MPVIMRGNRERSSLPSELRTPAIEIARWSTPLLVDRNRIRGRSVDRNPAVRRDHTDRGDTRRTLGGRFRYRRPTRSS